MATNPPIVIGPFTNVPAPGSGVKSDWPQQISRLVGIRHGFRLSASVSIPHNAITPVSFSVESTDSDNYGAVPATQYVIPAGMAGVYACTTSLSWTNPPGAASFHGIRIGAFLYSINSAGSSQAGASVTVSLQAGETIGVSAYNFSGAANILSCGLEAYRVSI